jgi:2-C-methyl-D-erythritol 2,4-cyclodiphosphate synthase
MTTEIPYRTGIGFDVHAFAEGRKLIIGGIEIPFEKGLAGHSDADALLHAICDAMLGALSLGDIGSHFPDTDPKFKNIDSTILLAKVNELINAENYEVVNVDSVIMLQRPKILPFVNQMREKISGILGVKVNQVSVKATTTEKLGFVGREEGISVMATVLISKK